MIGVTYPKTKKICSSRSKSLNRLSRLRKLHQPRIPRSKSNEKGIKKRVIHRKKQHRILRILKPNKMISTTNLGKRLSDFAYIGKRPYKALSINSDSESEIALSEMQARPIKKIIKATSKNPGEFIRLHSKEKIQIFPIFKDSDLKFEADLGSCTQRTVIDDDNDTSESLKDKAVKKMFSFMKRAVRNVRMSECGSCRPINEDSWDAGSVVSFENSMIEVDNSGTRNHLPRLGRSYSMVEDREFSGEMM